MDHKNLEAWKEATKFITEIYRITQNFPQHNKIASHFTLHSSLNLNQKAKKLCLKS